MAEPRHVGQRISYDGAICTVRYVGEVAGTSGTWLGVEWDDPSRGKHDGSHKGIRYFTCLSKSPTTASLVRPSRPADPSQSFIAALREKYASEARKDGDGRTTDAPIVISGKVAEELGFEKIRRKLAQIRQLKIVILDGMRVAAATDGREDSVAETCPSVVQLDLSRNLFASFQPVVGVCRDLPALRRLGLNGNRFQNVITDDALEACGASFGQVKELTLDETLLRWDEICHVARKCESLTALHAGTNQLSSLPEVNYMTLSTGLTSLVLEYNDFTAISDLSSLTALRALRNLHLKGNSIKDLTGPGSHTPVFSDTLQFLDVSYNNIQSWSFVDGLPTHFPGLTALRLAHNPVYEQQDPDAKASSSEEAHMFTVARLASLKSLNFTAIAPTDRANAEMFYMSRIAKQLAVVPESAEDSVTRLHPRYAELCGIYGAPDVIRREEIDPSFLEARLITVDFRCAGKEQRTTRIPKSFDIYAVKGIAGKLFGMAPLKLRLIWETGEWDPVAGFDEREGDSSDDEEEAPIGQYDETPDAEHQAEDEEQEGKPGRWVRREVELVDGPRQLGYCVDGTDVIVRIEAR